MIFFLVHSYAKGLGQWNVKWPALKNTEKEKKETQEGTEKIDRDREGQIDKNRERERNTNRQTERETDRCR